MWMAVMKVGNGRRETGREKVYSRRGLGGSLDEKMTCNVTPSREGICMTSCHAWLYPSEVFVEWSNERGDTEVRGRSCPEVVSR